MLTVMDKRAVAGRFAAAAGRYDASARVQARIAHALAERLAALNLAPGARVLEIGCGTGLLTAAALSRLPHVGSWLATDIAPSMADACRRRLAGDPRLSVMAMDGEMPAVEGPFDLICSSLALQWFPDAAGALGRWRGMLAPGGGLCVATLGVDTFAEWRRALAAAGAVGAGPAYPDGATLSRWLRPGGRVERQDFVEHHGDARHFLHSLRGIGADYAPGRLPAPTLRRAMRLLEATRPVAVTYDVRWLTVR
ncbi:methyltransferase [Niveispirillum sp. KHB5.9]|uniref:methyltransferase n=1 Tax=Niveispirillum sp. KHB5.9 TaxID=3400269 RepID=UPI003A877B80